MACYETGTSIGLTAGEAITLDDARGATLRVLRGTLWVTQERRHEDVILRAGDVWMVERNGATVIEAQDAARLYVAGRQLAAPPRRSGAPARGWGERFGQLLSLVPRRPLPYV
jgi:hypothetical protein